MVEQLCRCGQRNEVAVVDDSHAHRQGGGVLEGMGDQEAWEPQIGEQGTEFVADLLTGDRVQRSERLVEQQDLGFTGQRSRQCHTLPLASGELVWPRGGKLADANPFQQVGPVAFGGEPNVGRHREMGEQSVVLREVADKTTLWREVDAALGVEPRIVAERDVPGAGVLEAGDRSQDAGLARPGRPDQGDGLRAEGQFRAKLERPPREDDVDVEYVHVCTASLETRRIAALTMISSTPTEIAWSRLASNRE